MSPADVVALIRLQTAPKLGAVTLYKLLSRLSDLAMTPTQFVTLSAADITQSVGASSAWMADALAGQDPAAASEWSDKLLSDDWRLIPHTQADYPASLHAILGDKCPPLLYLKGHAALLNRPGVAFSGSRNVSERGLACAAALAKVAAAHGLTAVSGHAKGVDQSAHHAALESGGATVFVPSEGALRFRLRANLRPFTGQSPDTWVIVSQYAPMEGWHVGSAMGRNRTIIGLSRALFVIEAGVDGGTWDAALEAERLRHPLYVLHDPDPASGNAAILKRGKARPILDVDGVPHFPDLESIPPSDPAQHQLSLF